MAPWASARMARSILMEPRALPDTQGKDTAARAGPEIVAERVGPALSFLPLAISLHDEAAAEGSLRLLRRRKPDLALPLRFPPQHCCWLQ